MYQLGIASFKNLSIKHSDASKDTNIVFTSFWSNAAEFIFNGKKHTLDPDSLLLKRIDIIIGQKNIGEIELDWRDSGTIKLKNQEDMTKMFVLKSGSFLKNFYTLHDLLTNHLLTITQKWNWRRFNYDYFIKSEEGLNEEENLVDIDLLSIVALYTVYLICKKRRRKRNA